MYRISPTLLDSFNYYLSIEDREKGDSVRKELIDYLKGIKTTNAAMEAGIEFEKNIVDAVQGNYVPWNDEQYNDCVEECAKHVRGSMYQYHVEKELDGVIVHGVIDFLCGNTIIDCKTTSKYEIGKYTPHTQHLVYPYCLLAEGITNFVYLVTDFKNVYKEDYVWRPQYKDILRGHINSFMDYLKNDTEMRIAFESKDHTQKAWRDALVLKN